MDSFPFTFLFQMIFSLSHCLIMLESVPVLSMSVCLIKYSFNNFILKMWLTLKVKLYLNYLNLFVFKIRCTKIKVVLNLLITYEKHFWNFESVFVESRINVTVFNKIVNSGINKRGISRAYITTFETLFHFKAKYIIRINKFTYLQFLHRNYKFLMHFNSLWI